MPPRQTSNPFTPPPAVTIERAILAMTRAELDAFPLGIIELDRRGTILYYNDAEATLARRDAKRTVGLNFFVDVAPCTAVQAFEGRFASLLARGGDCCERFRFVFSFAWGKREVGITMVRRDDAGGEKIYLVVDATD